MLITLLVVGIGVATATASQALPIQLGDPRPFERQATGSTDLYATKIVGFDPVAPKGDTRPGLGGSAALYGPDDIGFFPEPDSNLTVALGTGGRIELAFDRSIVSDGILSAPNSLAGAELLIFEDGLLDGASFYGRMRQGGRLVPLGSLADVAILLPTALGHGQNGRDSVIGVDLDAIFALPMELISIMIVDDGITEFNGVDSQTFELDAIINRSPGTSLAPEPSPLVLLVMGLAAISTRSARASRHSHHRS
jgi:hypothetical protein